MSWREGCTSGGRAARLGSRPGHALERVHDTEGLATVTDHCLCHPSSHCRERAEDIYRIVSQVVKVPLTQVWKKCGA